MMSFHNAKITPLRDYSRAQTNAECRYDAALRDVRQRYARLIRMLTSRQGMEEARIRRDFLSGKFDR